MNILTRSSIKEDLLNIVAITIENLINKENNKPIRCPKYILDKL